MGCPAGDDPEEVLSGQYAWGAILAGAGLVASLSGAAVGIGGGLLVMPILSLWIPPAEVVAFTTPMFFVTTLVNFWRYRRSLAPRLFPWLIPGVLVGIVIGVRFLTSESPGVIRIIMGGIALTFGAFEAFRLIVRRPLPPVQQWLKIPLTFVAGLASALTNIGGTVVSIAMLGEDLSPAVFVGTLNAVMLLMGALKLGLFTAHGLIGMHGAEAALPSIPAAFLGSWIGKRLNRRLSPLVFRWALVLVIGISATLLLAGG